MLLQKTTAMQGSNKSQYQGEYGQLNEVHLWRKWTPSCAAGQGCRPAVTHDQGLQFWQLPPRQFSLPGTSAHGTAAYATDTRSVLSRHTICARLVPVHWQASVNPSAHLPYCNKPWLTC